MIGSQTELDNGIRKMMSVCFPEYIHDLKLPSDLRDSTDRRETSPYFDSSLPTTEKAGLPLSFPPPSSHASLMDLPDSDGEHPGFQLSSPPVVSPAALLNPRPSPDASPTVGQAVLKKKKSVVGERSKLLSSVKLARRELNEKRENHGSRILESPSKILSGVYHPDTGVCTICGIQRYVSAEWPKSANLDKLRCHARTHMEPVWECPFCGQKGSVLGYMKKHIK